MAFVIVGYQMFELFKCIIRQNSQSSGILGLKMSLFSTTLQNNPTAINDVTNVNETKRKTYMDKKGLHISITRHNLAPLFFSGNATAQRR